MTDIAFELMKQRDNEIVFNKLWEEVSKTLGLSENQAMNKIASFYSALMLDKRFALLPDNKWDLRERHTYNETHIDTSAIVIDDDDEEILDNDDMDDYEEEDEEKEVVETSDREDNDEEY